MDNVNRLKKGHDLFTELVVRMARELGYTQEELRTIIALTQRHICSSYPDNGGLERALSDARQAFACMPRRPATE